MLNTITLSGRLTADPELRKTSSGIDVATFTLAVNRDYTEKDGTRPADFFTCVAWRNTAIFASKWFKKGTSTVVNGRLETHDYTTKHGEKRKAYEIVVNNMYFFENKTDRKVPEFDNNTKQDAFTGYQDLTPDIPFM